MAKGEANVIMLVGRLKNKFIVNIFESPNQ